MQEFYNLARLTAQVPIIDRASFIDTVLEPKIVNPKRGPLNIDHRVLKTWFNDHDYYAGKNGNLTSDKIKSSKRKRVYFILGGVVALFIVVDTLLEGPGIIEFSDISNFMDQYSTYAMDKDLQGSDRILDENPLMTAILAHEIFDIPHAIESYHNLIAQIQ